MLRFNMVAAQELMKLLAHEPEVDAAVRCRCESL